MRGYALWLSLISAAICVGALPAPPQDTHTRPTEADLEVTDEDKRAWQNLHGGWGKRAWNDMNSAWGKRAWNDMNSAWGKRAWNDMNSAWGKRAWNDMNSAWGKRAWNDMNSAWGKRAWNDMNSAWGKRAWNDMNSAWGKRAWNDMSAAWGKRGLEGRWYGGGDALGRYPDEQEMWALYQEQPLELQRDLQEETQEDKPAPVPVEKREDKKAWSALHGTWGKRPVKLNNGFYWKREPGWTNLRGMWGKRSSEGTRGEQTTSDESQQRDA